MEIVAEFTYNHFGNIHRAKRMIDAAVQSGATTVKFEVRNSDKYFRSNPEARERKKKYEFSDEQIQEFVEHCRKVGINWFTSVHDIDSLKRIMMFNPKYVKIASREARCHEFVGKVVELIDGSYPLLISTGGLEFGEIENIYSLAKSENLTLIHTSCLYPCITADSNLNRIKKMQDTFGCKIGYSGHEQGFIHSLYAVMLGVNYLEKHFTIIEDDMGVAKGSKNFNDDLCTLTPFEFKTMTDAVKILTELRSQKIRDEVLPDELERINAYGKIAWDGDDIFLSND